MIAAQVVVKGNIYASFFQSMGVKNSIIVQRIFLNSVNQRFW